MITCSELHELFEYKNNELYWKVSNSPRVKIGDKAGTLNKGYIRIKIHKKMYSAHRLIFMMHHGYLPSEVDHKLDKSNNIDNLRAATKIQNGYNAKTRIDNTSGCKGVTWHKASKKWLVQLRFDKKAKYIGVFANLELADLVAIEARDKYHKEFARHK